MNGPGPLGPDQEQFVATCLGGGAFDRAPATVNALAEMGGDRHRVYELVAEIERRGSASNGRTAAAAIVRLFTGLAEAAATVDQEQVETVLRHLASSLALVSTATLVALLDRRPAGSAPTASRIVDEAIGRMTDQTIARFIVRNATGDDGSADELVHVFHTLVPEMERRRRVVAVAHEALAGSAPRPRRQLESIWDQIAGLVQPPAAVLRDASAYDRAPKAAPAPAQVEQRGQDPPERVATWLDTVTKTAVGALDLKLLVDLLQIEDQPARWRDLTGPVVDAIDDRRLVGDADAAAPLVTALRHAADATAPEVSWRRNAARTALERLSVSRAAAEPPAAERLLEALSAAVRAAQLYSPRHPIIARNVSTLARVVTELHASASAATIAIAPDGIRDPRSAIAGRPTRADVRQRLEWIGIERLVIDPGVSEDALMALVHAVAGLEPRTPWTSPQDEAGLPSIAHIRVDPVASIATTSETAAETATIRRLYSEAVSAPGNIWESAATDRQPDATAARRMVDALAHAVAQHRNALVALTTMQQYDSYTFTHMVNVAILTMGQARGLGVEGALLRDFGLAALLHDIGKVRTPMEILNKPDSLTADEFVIMKRHPIDGAEILRETPDMPLLAAVVAFEHHLRLDGSGYPIGAARGPLNLCTMLCSIADVYDAMRSQRQYQQSFPADRILQVIQRDDGLQFDRHLVRRFVQLLGVYPPGNLVRLDTGEIAVVVRTHATDPYRPHVRIVLDRDGVRLPHSYDVLLWENAGGAERPAAIVSPVNPADYGLDPLTFL